jgi:hypothetical protein
MPRLAASGPARGLRLTTVSFLAVLAAASSLAAAPLTDTVDAAGNGPGSRLDAAMMMARPNAGDTYVGRNMSWGGHPDPQHLCHPTLPICVHWAGSGDHAVPTLDDNHNGTPDQVDNTLAAVATSWRTIVGKLGFKRPLSDQRSAVNGGDDRFDVYLADTGNLGLSGYTSSDDPRLAKASNYRYRDVSAFIVLDNDYRDVQFPAGTSLGNLRVAAAHELFHAVEMAYDYREDPWLAEGSAAWVEDQVFDSVNLNVSYLQNSSLSAPLTPLDLGRQGHEYGAWLFLRYLSEHFGAHIITRIWRLADDSPDQVSAKSTRTYSMAAVRKALSRAGHEFPGVFARYMTANLRPGRYYDEGAANSYPRAFTVALKLGAKGSDTGWLGLPLDHLSATYVSFSPGDNTPRHGRLLVRVDGAPRSPGSRATVLVRDNSGRFEMHTVHLNRKGDGDIRVDFGRRQIAGVDTALINASTRYSKCFSAHTTLSCRGVSRDDGRAYRVRARVI